jgi:hypothetical protein
VTKPLHGRWSMLVLAGAAAAGAAAACARGAAAPAAGAEPVASPECADVCVVQIENRTPLQLDVIVRDGLSIRTLGVVPGYATVTVEVPLGIPARQIDARVPPGAISSGGAGRRLDCQFQQRGGGTARIVCEDPRG